jgi:hypothetical protein
MVNHSSNINKSKESVNSDGQQFYQYQQNILLILEELLTSLFKLSFCLLILEELLTITVKTFFWFVDIGGIVDITVQTFFWFVDIGRIVNHHC